MGRFKNNIIYDDATVAHVDPTITAHLVALSISLLFISGDSLSYHKNQQFTTKDRDNDEWSGNTWELNENCAVAHQGAWWYRSCYASNLNGNYFRGKYSSGIFWYHWKHYYFRLKGVNMKIRPYPF